METGVPKLKKLGLIATGFIVLAWLLVFVVSPVYAQNWESYKEEARTNVWGAENEEYGSVANTGTAWMKGTGFSASGNYKVAYYAGDNYIVALDDNLTADGDGELQSQYVLNTYTGAAAGLWHSVVYPQLGTVDMPLYNGTAGDGIAEDDFNVLAEAIPEFPTVITMITAMGLSFGIYYWMRQRHHRKVVTA